MYYMLFLDDVPKICVEWSRVWSLTGQITFSELFVPDVCGNQYLEQLMFVGVFYDLWTLTNYAGQIEMVWYLDLRSVKIAWTVWHWTIRSLSISKEVLVRLTSHQTRIGEDFQRGSVKRLKYAHRNQMCYAFALMCSISEYWKKQFLL